MTDKLAAKLEWLRKSYEQEHTERHTMAQPWGVADRHFRALLDVVEEAEASCARIAAARCGLPVELEPLDKTLAALAEIPNA